MGSLDTVVDAVGAFVASSCAHKCCLVDSINNNTNILMSWLNLSLADASDYIGQKITVQRPLAAVLIHRSSRILVILDMVSLNFVSADKVWATTTQVDHMTEHEFTRDEKGKLYSTKILFQHPENPVVCDAAIGYWVSL